MTVRKGLLIQPDGTHEFREIRSFLDIKEAVGGNFDWTSPGPLNYYCYEYALFERPVNPVATALYHETHPGIEDPLNGPVLITGPVVDEDDTDIPDQYVTRVQELRKELEPRIVDLAVPLTAKQQMDIQMQMMAAHNQATRALDQGQDVDFGGIVLSAQGPAVPSPLTDGNRRQGKS